MRNFNKILDYFYWIFYTFLKTQLPHCQTQAYDCGRDKTRLGGGATPKIGGGAIAPLAPCWLRPWWWTSWKGLCYICVKATNYHRELSLVIINDQLITYQLNLRSYKPKQKFFITGSYYQFSWSHTEYDLKNIIIIGVLRLWKLGEHVIVKM